MRLSARADIAAEPEAVFAELTEFERFERMALQAGAEVVRADALETPGAGMEWVIKAPIRGRMRRIDMTLVDLHPAERLEFHAVSQGFDMGYVIELLTPRPGKTRMQVAFDIRPKTLASRITLQSAKLRKATLSRRFDERVKRLARLIEDRIAEKTRRPGNSPRI